MPEITRMEKTFIYDIPDTYLAGERTLDRVAEWTYTGPRYIWIFVDNATNKISSRFHYTERDNGHDVPTPEGMTKVMVDGELDPVLISLFHTEQLYSELPHTTEILPDGSVYGHPVQVPPDHTYELGDIEYNPATGEFIKPYPFKKPHMDWETLIAVRNAMLGATDSKYAMATEEQKPAWEEYRQKLRDIPTTFAGIDPWKVPFPEEPFAVKQPTE